MPVARLSSSLVAILLASTALVGIAPARAQGVPAGAHGLPTGGQVVSGGVTIGTPSGGAMTITQSSQSAIVNWQGFSIGSSNRVDIRQPDAQSAILNRVTGDTPSTIAGQLNANGQVYLVNPNGITITRSGRVNAEGGFVASTLGIADEDFKAGRRQFRGSGASAKVTNHGTVTVGRGGYAALIGGRVSNSGTIAVPMGKVGLGSGEQATLDLSGDGFLQVAVPTNAKGRGALVSHSGTISADGGSVVLTAAAARDMARQAVNLSGTVEARAVSGRNGSITLSGGDGTVTVGARARLDASGAGTESGGRVRVTGRHVTVAGNLDASGGRGGRISVRATEGLALTGTLAATGRTGQGGRVVATAPEMALTLARIDVSGAAGGGVVRLGGGRQGAGRLAHAQNVAIDAGTEIRADAIEAGTGGDVVVWSDASTRFAGTISARGGALSGNGGEAEVSSKGHLAYDGRTDLTAAKGAFGTLLLDPYNITISSGTQTADSGFSATGDDSVINAGTLLTALASANVSVTTGPHSVGSQAGDITVTAPLSWSSGATLSLQATNAITLNAAITAPAGGLTLATGGGGTISATDAVSVGRFTLMGGSWVQNAAILPGFAAGDFQIRSGSFLRATGGDGTSATPYLLADIYGVQGMGTSGSYRLAADIDAAGTAAWNGAAGFRPVGNNGTPFIGSLDGAGHTISGLTINRSSENSVGLIGNLGAGSVTQIGLLGGSTKGGTAVGGLVGSNNGGTISRSYTTGSVTGGTITGGLVGFNAGSIATSYSNSTVTGNVLTGGLVGRNRGSISESYATGSVTGSDILTGGLIGESAWNGSIYATITRSYATGSVTGTSYVGGFVGRNSSGGKIDQSYSSGAVTGTTLTGGFAGYHDGTSITGSFWDKDTSGKSSGVGQGYGLMAVTGLSTADARTASKYTGFDFSTVWYQAGDMRPILRSEAATAVNGVVPVSNLHQLQLMGANLAASYTLTADIDAGATSSTAASAGIWGASGFVPVGNNTSAFTGSLAGAGHTVSGLTIALPSQYHVGLIGSLGSGATVSGVGLVGGSVTANGYVGSLVGNNSGTVSQSYATGSVKGSSNRVGGLVGTSSGTVSGSYATGSVTNNAGFLASDTGGLVGWSSGTVDKSYATGSVTSSGGFGNSGTGGLVGTTTGTVSQSYASGTVTGQDAVGGLVGTSGGAVSQSYALGAVSGSDSVGGLVGSNNLGSTLTGSYASGSVTGSSRVGGLVGYNNSGTLTGNYWDTASTGRAAGVGSGTATGATGLITAQARASASYAGFDFSTVWYQAGDMRPILRAEAATADAKGVVAVSNLHQLQLMGTNLAGSYRLTKDIDASTTAGTAASSGIWGATGFVPVGDYSSNFTGSLDGAGHAISGLTVNGGGTYVGLIGYLGTNGRVSGLGLVGGSVSGGYFAGGVAAYVNYGTVDQSYNTGSVSGSFSIGGIAGYNNYGTVSQSYATGSISSIGSSSNVGGIVGYNYGTVNQSYATGSVSGTNAGGVVAYNQFGTVSQSYATGSVSGTANAGGLVGTNNGTLRQSYAIGSVSGASNVGGLVGNRRGGLLTNLYWDTQTTGQANGFGAGLTTGATGLTTAQMQDLTAFRATYAGFDFATVWAPPNQAGQGGLTTAYYPQLYGVSPVIAVTPVAVSRKYNTDNPDFVATYAGLRSGDFITNPGTFSTSAITISPVGDYAVTAAGAVATSPAGRIYRIVTVPNATGLTIIPATVTATASLVGTVSKTYDGTTVASLLPTHYSLSGVAPADTASVSVAGTGATFDSAGVGTGKTVTATGLALSGAASGNYVLASTTASAAIGSITPAPLTVTAKAASKTYDGQAYTGGNGVSYAGLVNGEGPSVIGGSVSYGGTAQGAVNAGTYAITPSGLTSANYAVTFADGALTVNQAPLTVTANAATRTYDGQAFTGGNGVSYAGLVNGEGPSVLGGSVSYGGTAQGAVNAGSYAITPSSLTSANYAITFADGSLTVAKAPLAASVAGSATKVYDGTGGAPLGSLTYGLSGLVGTDAVTVAGTAAAYDSAQGGTGK
ncbi:GLUG motif-containing protein, partial [Methylobacterium sp. EM32]|uniref:two-partner secretion domain-containing protein n=1 Tax=Methylobacterium sp. EM32 TaxID=3163481 RepID=UPI0033AB6EC4